MCMKGAIQVKSDWWSDWLIDITKYFTLHLNVKIYVVLLKENTDIFEYFILNIGTEQPFAYYFDINNLLRGQKPEIILANPLPEITFFFYWVQSQTFSNECENSLLVSDIACTKFHKAPPFTIATINLWLQSENVQQKIWQIDFWYWLSWHLKIQHLINHKLVPNNGC